jgi:hypothetical protein
MRNMQIRVKCDNPKCPEKNKDVWISPSKQKLKHHFHNARCFGEWRAITNLGENNPNYGNHKLAGVKQPERSAQVSGEKNGMFGRKGIKSPIFGDKNPMKIPELKAKHLKVVTSAEFRKNMSEAQIGEKNGNWRGGITSETKKFINSRKYADWRKSVIDRDNHVCRKCDKSDRKFRIHHQYSKSSHKNLGLVVSNGITFCEDCHVEFHHIFGKLNNTPAQVIQFLLEVV